MTKGLSRSISRGNALQQASVAVRATVNTTITVDGATGIGFGSAAIAGLPEAHLLFLGGRADLTFTEADAGMSDTWSGDFGIGTTPADDGTITAADVDLVGSTALGPATAGVASAAADVTTPAVIDNSAGTGEVNLNLLVDDADISADGVAVTVTGYVTLAVVALGDD